MRKDILLLNSEIRLGALTVWKEIEGIFFEYLPCN